MFTNYIKIAFRHLRNNKFFTFLNVVGLAIGMAVAIVIGMWLWDEISYNSYHPERDLIAAVMQNNTFEGEIETWWSQALPTAEVLRNDYGSNFEHVAIMSFPEDHTLRHDDQSLSHTGRFSEAGGEALLGLQPLYGELTVLDEPNTLLIAARMARSHFGREDVVGESLTLDGEQEMTIKGVYQDLPANSSSSYLDFLGSWSTYTATLPEWIGWGNSWFSVLVQIKPNTDFATVSERISLLKQENAGEDGGLSAKPTLFLHPMKDWRLYSEFENGKSVGGRITQVRALVWIGLIILFLACINFMNLSTARSEKRALEIGIRKTMGSRRSQLIGQFYSESLLLAFGGGTIGLLTAGLLLPFFNSIVDKEMTMPLDSPWFWGLIMVFCLFTGLLAGSYPALHLSSFKPANALKGLLSKGRKHHRPREVLVIVQFAISAILIVSTLVVHQQIDFAKNRPLGFNQGGLIGVPLRSDNLTQRFTTFREDLLNTGLIEEVAQSDTPITSTFVTNSGLSWPGKPADFQDEFVTLRVSPEFGNTVDWNIIDGRDFSRDFPSDSSGMIVNQAALNYMGLTDPLGQQIEWGDNGLYTIVGVVEDMITQSPYTPVRQMLFFIDYSRSNYATVKLADGADTEQAIAALQKTYQKYDPDNVFEYRFMDEMHAEKFGDEVRFGRVATFFTILAIFISCLGLFGMATYVTERRAREIGIRKVLGASVSGIVGLISGYFLKMVLVALLIAAPLAYLLMSSWLNDYAYRITLSAWFFVVAGGLALTIAFLTVSLQSLRAAVVNPLHVIRKE